MASDPELSEPKIGFRSRAIIAKNWLPIQSAIGAKNWLPIQSYRSQKLASDPKLSELKIDFRSRAIGAKNWTPIQSYLYLKRLKSNLPKVLLGQQPRLVRIRREVPPPRRPTWRKAMPTATPATTRRFRSSHSSPAPRQPFSLMILCTSPSWMRSGGGGGGVREKKRDGAN